MTLGGVISLKQPCGQAGKGRGRGVAGQRLTQCQYAAAAAGRGIDIPPFRNTRTC